MPTYLIAHDAGTTGNKATLFDEDGRLLASAFSPYATSYPEPGWAEQDPSDWWQAVCTSTRQLLISCPENVRSQLGGVGFSGMMNGCLMIDGRGNKLGPSLIHADSRSTAQCVRISQEIGAERAYDLTGNRIAPYFTLSKLAWMQENRPEVVSHARYCVQTKDYLIGRMTGIWGVTDRSDASLYGCFDMARGEWSKDLISAGGFASHLLPQVQSSASIVGKVTLEAADATGLPYGLPVVMGGGDGACATAGSGSIRHGDTYHYLGGTSWVAAVTEGYRPDPTRRVSVFCGLDPSQYVVYGTVQSAGSSVDWFLKAIGPGEIKAGEDEYSALDRLAGSAMPGSRGLFFLPYLAGERSPIWDAASRGVYFGLSQAHGRAELARSVFEGVGYALGSNLKALLDLGFVNEAIRVLGGGMRSPLWRSILAAIYNRPIEVVSRLSEATSCGAAMATGVGIGLYSDYAEAALLFANVSEREYPDPDLTTIYAAGTAFFQTLYPTLADRFRAASEANVS